MNVLKSRWWGVKVLYSQKAELVITDLRDRMDVYQQMRKMRTTKEIEERVSSLGRDHEIGGTFNAQSGRPEGLNVLANLIPANFSPPPTMLSPKREVRPNHHHPVH